MKKNITLLISTFLLCISVQAQDFQFGLKSGFHQDVFTITHNNGKLAPAIDFLSPGIDFSFKTIFPNNIEVGTGIGYYNYECNLRMKTSPWPKSYSKEIAYRSFSIPVNIGYNLNLYAGLYLNFNMGLHFDFYFNHADGSYHSNIGTEGEQYLLDYYLDGTPTPKFNVLLSNTLTLYYMTKSNVYVGLFGAYHAGMRDALQAQVFYQEGTAEMTTYHMIASKGSFWNFGLEIGYRLTKKK